MVGCTGVNDLVKGGWSQRHDAVGGSKGGGILASSEWELRRSLGRRGHSREPAPEDGRHSGPDPATWRWFQSRGCRTMTSPSRHPGRWNLHGWNCHPRVRPYGGSDRRVQWKPGEGHRYHNRRTSGGPGRRGARGLSHGGRLSASGSAIEDRGQRGCLNCHGELLKEKLISHDMECGKWHGGGSTSRYGPPSASRGHGGSPPGLHLAIVLPHGGVPLREPVELGVEVQGVSVLVTEEVYLEGERRAMACV